MGTILKFNSPSADIGRPHLTAQAGEVVFFPGVRYERHDRPKSDSRTRAAKLRATRNRKRTN